MENSKKLLISIAILVLLGLPLIGQLGKISTASAPAPVRKTAVPPPVAQQRAPVVPAPVYVAPTAPVGVIENAYRNRTSNLPVTGTGTVSRILSDDNQGSRHQRFIVQLPSGHTVLIAHNIDIAPRINSLQQGGQITFSGVFEWNDKGGVVHWTHHDPSRQHAGGYLQYNGSTYQ